MHKTEENFFSLVKVVEDFNAKCLYYKNKNLKHYIFSDKGLEKNFPNSNSVDEKKEFFRIFSDFIRKINILHQNFLEYENSCNSQTGTKKKGNEDINFSEEKRRDLKKIYSLSKNKNLLISSIEKKENNKKEKLNKVELVKVNKNVKTTTSNLSIEYDKEIKSPISKSLSVGSTKIYKLKNKRKMKDNSERVEEKIKGKIQGKSKIKGKPNELLIEKESDVYNLNKTINIRVECPNNDQIIKNRNFNNAEDENDSCKTMSDSGFDSQSNYEKDKDETEEDEEIKKRRNSVLTNYVRNLEYGINVIRMSREQLIEEIKEFYILHNNKIKLNEYSKCLNKNLLNELKEKIKKDNLNFIDKNNYVFDNRKHFFVTPKNYFFIRNYDNKNKTCVYTSNNTTYETSVKGGNNGNGYAYNSPKLKELSNFGNSNILTRSNSYSKLNSPNFGTEDQKENKNEEDIVNDKNNDKNKENKIYEIEKEDESELIERKASPNFGSFEVGSTKGEEQENFENEINVNENSNIAQLQTEKNMYISGSAFNASLELNSNSGFGFVSKEKESVRCYNVENNTPSKYTHSGYAMDYNNTGNFNCSSNEMIIYNQFFFSGDELANSFPEQSYIEQGRGTHSIHSNSNIGLGKREKDSNTDINTVTYESTDSFQNLESNYNLGETESFKNHGKICSNNYTSDFCKSILDFYKNKENDTNFDENNIINVKNKLNSLNSSSGNVSGNSIEHKDSQKMNNCIVNLSFDDELVSVEKPNITKRLAHDEKKRVICSTTTTTNHFKNNKFTKEKNEKETELEINDATYIEDENKWLNQYCEGDYNLYRSKQLKKKKEIVLDYLNKWKNKMQKERTDELKKCQKMEKEKDKIISANINIGNIDHMSYFDLADENYYNTVYNALNLRVIYEVNKSACEYYEDMHFFLGQIIVNKYKVQKILSKTKFSTTLKCLNLHYKRDGICNLNKGEKEKKDCKYLCLKVMKSGKSYFDQGLFELIVLNVLNESRLEYSMNKELNHNNMHSNNAFSNNAFSNKNNDIYTRGSKNIIELYDYFYYKEQLVIVTEYMQSDLYNYFIKKGKMGTLGQLQILAKSILEGLAFIHSNNLIHCDLKPENIMINMKRKSYKNKSKSIETDKDETALSDLKKVFSFSNQSKNECMLNEKNVQLHKKGTEYISGQNSECLNPNCSTSFSANGSIEKKNVNNTLKSDKTKRSFDLCVSAERQRIENNLKNYENTNGEKKKFNSAFTNMNSNVSAFSSDVYGCNTINSNAMTSNYYSNSIAGKSNIFSDEKFDKIKIIDFNSAIYESDKLEMYVQTRSYRSPEVLLQENYDRKIDIWSLGCILFEFLTKKILFDYENLYRFIYSIASYIGTFPFYMIKCCKIPYMFTKHGLIILEKVVFNKNGNTYYKNKENNESDDEVIFNSKDFFRLNQSDPTIESVHNNKNMLVNLKTTRSNNQEVYYDVCYPSDNLLKSNFQINDTLFIDFLLSLLQIDPVKRPTAVSALNHPWLQQGLYKEGL